MISRNLYNHIQSIIDLRRMSKEQAEEMQRIIREKINPKYSVCTKCGAQMKHGQQILRNYLNSQMILEDYLADVEPVVEDTVLEMPVPEPDVDVKEADKVGCTKCKRKAKNKN